VADLDTWTSNPQAERFMHVLPVPDDETPATHDVQAAAEGVTVEFDLVEFLGEKFRLAEQVGMMPMLAFGNAAKQGLDTDDMAGMAAMYRMIRSVIHRPPLLDENGRRQRDENGKTLRDESEWHRFEELADDELAEGEDLMKFVNQAMEVMAARPTRRRSISADTSPPTSERSRDVSSLPARRAPEGLTRVADL
jgi:hypothetical protein